ncbi:hypothetical protein CHUAL_006943 [Chamberlinius hualienensis]
METKKYSQSDGMRKRNRMMENEKDAKVLKLKRETEKMVGIENRLKQKNKAGVMGGKNEKGAKMRKGRKFVDAEADILKRVIPLNMRRFHTTEDMNSAKVYAVLKDHSNFV